MARSPGPHHLARARYINARAWPRPATTPIAKAAKQSKQRSEQSRRSSCAHTPPRSKELHSTAPCTSAAADEMGNSLRCFLACACGALDVVRVVHLSGRVDEFSGPIAAAAVLAEHPNHTLTTAWSPSGAPGCASKKLVVVSPDSELKRGRIYFLIPSATLPADRRAKKQGGSKKSGGKRSSSHHHRSKRAGDTAEQDNYLRELLTEKTASSGHGPRRRRSSARVGVWRPQLESIVEEASD